jgi:hypothetical protein
MTCQRRHYSCLPGVIVEQDHDIAFREIFMVNVVTTWGMECLLNVVTITNTAFHWQSVMSDWLRTT